MLVGFEFLFLTIRILRGVENFTFRHLRVGRVSIQGLWWEARLEDTDGSYGKSLWGEVVRMN